MLAKETLLATQMECVWPTGIAISWVWSGRDSLERTSLSFSGHLKARGLEYHAVYKLS